MRHIALPAFAKLNLGLEVLRRREDGYHEINTVFARVRLADMLLLCRNDDDDDGTISLTCSTDLNIPANENLAYQAAERLQMALGVNSGAHIELRKHIPSGAGLGGGSSDAAAVLRQLPNLWDVEAPECTLHKVAAGLGSDVPFFLEDQAAVGSGRGEQLERFEFQIPWWTLIVHPGIHISTPWAYRALGLAEGATGRNATDFRSALLQARSNPQILRDRLHNDFESVVFDKYPHVRALRDQLYSGGAHYAAMSGSGSAVFGFYSDAETAHAAAAALNEPFTEVCAPFEDH